MTRVYVIDMGRKFYYLQWDDPTTGKRITRTSKKTNRREAERAAIAKEKEIAESGGIVSRLSWDNFFSRFQMEHLQSLALRTRLKACSVLETYERLMEPRTLSAVTGPAVSTYAAKLREGGRRESTIASHLRTIHAALMWAKSRGFISCVPEMPKIHRTAGSKAAKGRPITIPEFVRMLRAASALFDDSARWERLLIGLWLSGLRIGEGMRLRWEPGNHPSIDLSGCGWLIIPAASDKAHRDRRIPLPQDFARWLRRAPQKTGLVFAPEVDENRACKVISAIGRSAGIIVDHSSGRTATAHDLRRAFAQRWASRLQPIDLQRLMRHASIQTTQDYYIDADADGLAARLVNYSVNSRRKTQ